MEALLEVLAQHHADYAIIRHTPTLRSAQEGADYFGIAVGQTAPTLIVKSDKTYYAVILSGSHGRIDMNALEQLLHTGKLKLAKPEEVEQVTGSTIGSVSLINPGLPTILDRKLYGFPYVYGGTGSPGTTLKIAPEDLEKCNDVVGYIE